MGDAVDLLEGLDVDIPEQVLKTDGGAVAPAEATAFFGPYQLIQEVGNGGVARVHRARHIHPRYAETLFAIKVLHEELSANPQVVQLFRNEAYVLAMLNHANVVRTFEAGEQDQKLFIAMEFIDGRDLDQLIFRAKKAGIEIPMGIMLHIASEVLQGLSFAHDLCDADGNRLNLVHRDVNPANVFLSYDGRIKLGDFGVAAIAAGEVEKSREVAGKIGYFAPEQLAGEKVDQRADLFAVGVMMWEMLCGQRLFAGTDQDQVMRLNARAKIPRPSKVNPYIDGELEAVVLKALERRPADRFPSAREMLAELKPCLASHASMTLAVAALMRKAFLREHIQEMQLREGLAGISARGSGQLIALYSKDERAQAAFNELLLSRGYRVETHETFTTLGDSLAGGNPPHMVLIDVGAPNFATQNAMAAVRRAKTPVPLVAVSESLTVDWVEIAHALGAVDLLFKPFNVERVLTGVRAAITGAARLAAQVSEAAAPQVTQHVLMVSRDPDLIARLSSGLTEHGFEVDVSPTTDEAVERTGLASYHFVLFDAHPPHPHDRQFAAQVRGWAGVGLVPVVYLADPNAHRIFAGVEGDRCAVRLRNVDMAELVKVFDQLRADTRQGRTFVRFPANLQAELRHGGRTFKAQAIDISRGGVMLRCEQMPTVGTKVSVSLRLPTAASPIEVAGCVARVELPKDEQGLPGVGVEFERFAGRNQADLISYLATLDRSPTRHATMRLQAPPGVRA